MLQRGSGSCGLLGTVHLGCTMAVEMDSVRVQVVNVLVTVLVAWADDGLGVTVTTAVAAGEVKVLEFGMTLVVDMVEVAGKISQYHSITACFIRYDSQVIVLVGLSVYV